jgi:hypothetical protein
MKVLNVVFWVVTPSNLAGGNHIQDYGTITDISLFSYTMAECLHFYSSKGLPLYIYIYICKVHSCNIKNWSNQ